MLIIDRLRFLLLITIRFLATLVGYSVEGLKHNRYTTFLPTTPLLDTRGGKLLITTLSPKLRNIKADRSIISLFVLLIVTRPFF